MSDRRHNARFPLATAAAIGCLATGGAGAVDGESETLIAGWRDARAGWSERGVTTEVLFKGTAMAVPVGGMKRGADYMQNLELKVGLDTAKLAGIPDSTAFLHVILNGGGKMNAAYVGSLMGVDNSEVAENTPKLFQAWFSKDFAQAQVSALVGVYPIDTEFYVTDSSGIFVHPSFGMAAELAQTGRHGPSIYPLTSLGIRLKYQPTPLFYAQAALVDADPGDSRRPHWTRINPFHGDGSLFIAELGSLPGEAHHAETLRLDSERQAVLTPAQRLEERYEPIGKYAIGYWSYSERFEDQFDNDPAGRPIRRKNRGAYVLMENSLYRAPDMGTDAAAFLRYGRADKNVNLFDYSISVGLRIRGLFTGRVDDFFGIAATRAHAGAKYRLAQSTAGIDAPAAETAVETTYRAQIRPWLALQPILQRILNPGLDPAIRNATVVGIRCEISL